MKFTLRIKKNRVFKYVFRKGDFYKGETLVIHVCKTKNNNMKNFFAVCVSKKNGKSVQRNKLKRWVREVYKVEESKLKKNYNIIVVYKRSVTFENVTFKYVQDDIIKGFKELNLYEQN